MIQSLERAVNILRLVAENEDGIRLCDLSRACGMNRNTIFNLADTLVKERLLEKTSDCRYVIGDLILELAGGQKRNKYLILVEKELCELHLRYPDAAIYYSELGGSDIFTRLYFARDNPGMATYPDGTTLNPYLTVAGLAFFAFMPEERLISLRAKNPFEYQGLNAWGNIGNFVSQVGIAKKKGYAETPRLTPPTDFKVGIPVRSQGGDMTGAITFHLHTNEIDRRKVLGEIKTCVGKILR